MDDYWHPVLIKLFLLYIGIFLVGAGYGVGHYRGILDNQAHALGPMDPGYVPAGPQTFVFGRLMVGKDGKFYEKLDPGKIGCVKAFVDKSTLVTEVFSNCSDVHIPGND